MLLSSDAINASCFTLRVLLLHVDFKGLLILVVPIALWTLEGLARVSGDIPASTTSHARGAEDEVALGTFFSCGTAIDVIRASSNGCALQHIGISCSHAISRHTRKGT